MNEGGRDLREQLWKEIASTSLSPSHDHWHVERVLAFARILRSEYGGDEDVLHAAVVLHDLGRDDPTRHGEESVTLSVSEAEKILGRVQISDEKKALVLQAILEHDKPEITPQTLEGLILKEADFLSGFGAWGALRICMWAGETGGGVHQVKGRLKHRMPARFGSLQLPLSRRIAAQELQFARLFLSELEKPVESHQTRNWPYVVFEGISGAGKDTQIETLKKRLTDRGLAVRVLREPSNIFKPIRDAWEKAGGKDKYDPVVQMFLLLATRYESFRDLREQTQDLVIGNRSYLSTLIYQENNVYSTETICLLHSFFVPQPDLVIVLDISAEQAYARIKGRPIPGRHETYEFLKEHRPLYPEVLKSALPSDRLAVLDASQQIHTLATQVWNLVEPLLQQESQFGSK